PLHATPRDHLRLLVAYAAAIRLMSIRKFTATPAVASVNRMSTYWLTGSAESGWAPVTHVASASMERPARDTGGNVQPLAMPATARAWPTTRPNPSRSSPAPNERWRTGAAAVLTVSDRAATAVILTRACQRAAG